MKSLLASRVIRLLRTAWSGAATPVDPFQHPIESLESRVLLSVNVSSYLYGPSSAGVDSAETVLNPTNVAVGTFGKEFSVSVDGNVYAEPLEETGIRITAGVNTTAGAVGTHNVVFVATEHDSIYAIDTSTGAILWQRTFLSIDPSTTGSMAGTDINNPLGASAITTLPATDTGSTDITPEIGITGTPVIDPTTNRLYVSVQTKETIGGVANWVQRIHAVNLSNGTDVVTPYLIAETSSDGPTTTNIYVYGDGDGALIDPYNGTGKQVVQFTGLRENQRAALSLVNNVLYVAWASHGDQSPYHGWVVAWNVGNLAVNGFVLQGVFNSTPNGGAGGIWQGGAPLVFESGGTALYTEVGNGSGSNATYDANGFPTDGNYGESLVKLVPDTTTSPTNQSLNGWGFRVADFFTPYNRTNLDENDTDFGSGGMLILPTGIPGHPNLILASGKEGKVYVLDRNNLGKFSPTSDNALNSVPNGDGSGDNTPSVIIPSGLYTTPVRFDGSIFAVGGQNGMEYTLTLASDGILTATPIDTSTETDFGYVPGSPVISSYGASDGILWQMDTNAGVLRAFNAADPNVELWDSGQAANSADALDSTVKFAVPTIANGQVFVGTSDDLTVYGLENTGAVLVANAAEITGNAYDKNDLAAPDSVEIDISDGPLPQTILANLPSPELQSAFGTTSNDFDYTMPVLSVGTHTVSIYAITAGTHVRSLLETTTVTSQNSLFDEHYYLEMNPDVAAAVAAGTFATGYDHYIKYGQFEGRSPSPYWDEAYYLQVNPDVAAAVKDHQVSSGFMHYYLYGQYENRQGVLYYNNTYYLQNNPDVAAAVAAKSIASGFEHFVLYGQYENRAPMLYFSAAVYNANNTDILPYISGETFTSDFEHFIIYGQYEDRIASNYFNEQVYLADNPDVAAAVAAGKFKDGFQHWLEYGQYEGRTAV